MEKVFDSRQLEKTLTGLFAKEKLWEEQSLRCIGCGACAYVCPTCACFDIQDEGWPKTVSGCAAGIPAVSRCSPCIPPGTTPAICRASAGGSA